MTKLKLTKIQSAEVKALEEARVSLDSSRETLEEARVSLEEAKASKAKNKASLIGNAYIAFSEAEEEVNKASVAYTEALKKAESVNITFPHSDSKEEWTKKGLEKEYTAISLWYKASDCILEALNASKNANINRQDIDDYINAYSHQLTNCNDMVRLGYISEHSNLVVKNKANYAFVDKESRQTAEAKEAKASVLSDFQTILECLLESFIE